MPKKDKCPTCGKPITQTPGKRKKKYCNSSCRSKRWHRKRAAERKKDDNTLPLPSDYIGQVEVRIAGSNKPVVSNFMKQRQKSKNSMK